MKKKIILLILITLTSLSYSQRTAGEYNIKVLKENSDKSDFGPAFYGDGYLVFASSKSISGKKWEGNNQSFLDLYICEILENGNTGNLQKFDNNVNGEYHESSVSFTPDGEVVYFTRNNNNFGEEIVAVDTTAVSKKKKRGRHKKKREKASSSTKNMSFLAIYRADVIDGKWKNIEALPFNNKNYSVAHPSVDKDGKKLYFSSGASGFGMSDIFVVDINEDGTYSEPRNLGKKINTRGRDNFPFIDDKNILYFSSDSRVKGIGGLDIYAAKIYDDGSISDVLHLPEPINTLEDDFSFIVNNDIDQGYFSSNREEGGVGDDDIYYFNAHVPLSFECQEQLSGIARNAKTSKILPNTIIAIYSGDEKIKEVNTDDEGHYSVGLKCDSKIKLFATKKGFDGDEKIVKTSGNYTKKHRVDFKLKPVICNQLVTGTVLNSTDKTPLSRALITIYNEKGKRIDKTKTDSRGKFSLDLTCSSNYRVTAIKKDFEMSETTFSTTDDNRATQTVSLELKKYVCNKTVSGIVNNNNTKQPLGNVTITVFNESDMEVTSTTSDSNGNYSMLLDCKQKYKIIASKKGFESDEVSFKIKKSNVAFDFNLNIKIEEVIRVRDKIIVNINPIYFELDSYKIVKDAAIELDKVVAIMKKYPNLKIEAGSHTDSRGPSKYNKTLSSKRANSTVNYITKKGVDGRRIYSKGYGENQPTNRCVDGVNCSKDEHSQNRRTEFVILNPEILNLD
ncbi:MAG: OmpA family protein [Flavobacteriaceae bacterium]